MAAPAASNRTNWNLFAVQPRKPSTPPNAFVRCAMRLPLSTRRSIAKALTLWIGRLADWAATLDPDVFEEVKWQLTEKGRGQRIE